MNQSAIPNQKLEDLRNQILAALTETCAAGALVEPDVLSGYSGAKLIGLLQRLARIIEHSAGLCYAEIGVFQGLTLLSVAAAAPRLVIYGIDDFSQFDPDNRNKRLVLDRQRKLSLMNVHLVDQDYDEVLRRFVDIAPGHKIGLLFVDGPHDYRSQLMCMLFALPHLAENALIVVDDCNYEHVRLATRDLLLIDPQTKLVFEAYTDGHPQNVGPEIEMQMRAGWWNGVHLLVRGPVAAYFGGLVPAFGNARQRCEREHLLQPHGADEFATDLYNLAYDLAEKPTVAGLREGWQLIRRLRQSIRSRHLFRLGNTYSTKATRSSGAAVGGPKCHDLTRPPQGD
jgi:tRNA G46 methylase TrmB